MWCTCTGGAAAQAVKTTPVTVSAAAAPAAPCGVVNCTQRRSLRTIGRYHPYGSWSCCIVPPARCGDSLFCARDCRCPLSACYYVRELRSGARSDLMEFGGYCHLRVVFGMQAREVHTALSLVMVQKGIEVVRSRRLGCPRSRCMGLRCSCFVCVRGVCATAYPPRPGPC